MKDLHFLTKLFVIQWNLQKGFVGEGSISVSRRRAFERFHTTEGSLFKYLEPLERYFKSTEPF